MRQRQFWLSLGMIFSVLFNALPLPAQSKTAVKTQTVEINITTNSEPKEVFRTFLQSGRDGVFSQLIKKIGGRSYTYNLEETLEAQSVEFFEAMNAASKDDLTLVAAKATEISQKNYEELQKSPTKIQQTTYKKPARRGGPSPDDESFFDFESETPNTNNQLSSTVKFSTKTFAAEGEPVITKTETDTGVQVTGSASKTTELAEATVTQNENADNKLYFDGKSMTLEDGKVTKIEAVSNVNNQKVTKITKTFRMASFNVCPDTNGIVQGKLKVYVNNQVVVNLGKEIAALTNEITVEFKITGYVNEDAVMTHFDMEGETVDTKTGYDRAKKGDLVKLGDDISDGSQRAKYKVDNSEPPYQTENERGWKQTVDIKFGNLIGFLPDTLNAEQANNLNEVTVLGIQMVMYELSGLMRSSIYKWQNYECVDVECTAAKNTLTPGEHIDVNAVSISKQDLSKFNAKLEGKGNASVTPPDQFGTPKAVYDLTATSDGTAFISVRSISRRGIGFGILEIGESWQDDKEICDGNWQGTVEIRKSFEEEFKKTTKPGEVNAKPRMSGYQETINRYKYEGSVKIGSPKLFTANVSLMNATFMASAERYNLNQGYFLDPGECGWNKPTTARDESGTEVKESGSGEGATDITIQVDGSIYRVTLDIPKINGSYFRRNWRKPSGYCQPQNNIPTEKNENDKTYFDRMGISFEGTINPKQPDVLNGTKTLTSDDGKTKTIITWRLKRCVPDRGKTKSLVRK